MMNRKTKRILCFVSIALIISGIIILMTTNAKEMFTTMKSDEINTSKDLDKYTKKYDVVIVKFRVSWCGYCKKLAPIWERLNKKHDESTLKSGRTVKLVSLDCDKHKKLAKSHGIQGFPTIKIFKEDRVYEYNDANTFKELDKFIKEL
tara:strand:- start:3422 stop:3865 length:444 start_codon:yes stop_codon:yes gene_type:complete